MAGLKVDLMVADLAELLVDQTEQKMVEKKVAWKVEQ